MPQDYQEYRQYLADREAQATAPASAHVVEEPEPEPVYEADSTTDDE